MFRFLVFITFKDIVVVLRLCYNLDTKLIEGFKKYETKNKDEKIFNVRFDPFSYFYLCKC